MSYQKTDWKTGDTITQDKLNAIENQLESLSSNDNNRQAQLDNIESSIAHTEKTGAIVEMDYCGESTPAHSIIKNLSIKFSASNSGNNLPKTIYGISTANVQFIKKDANLLQPIESEESVTNNGITFTRTTSGKLTIQGTASDTAVYFYPFSIPLFANSQAKPTITVAILNTAINDNIEVSLQSYHQQEALLNTTHALDGKNYINPYTIATTVSGLVFTVKNGANISTAFTCTPVVLYGSHDDVSAAVTPKASDRKIITINLENILNEKGYIGEYNLTTGVITNNALVLNLNELEWTVVGTPGEQFKIVTTTLSKKDYYKNGQYAQLTDYKYLGISDKDHPGEDLTPDDPVGVGYYPTGKTDSRRIFCLRIPITDDKPKGLFVCERATPKTMTIEDPQINISTPSSNELLAWADCGRITVDYYINQYDYFSTLHDTQSTLDLKVKALEIQNSMQSNDISELEETTQNLQQTVQDIAATLDWSGKKVSIIGDSISAYPGTITLPNNSIISAPVYPSGDVSSVATMWWHQLLDYTGAKLEINASQASSRVVDANVQPNFFKRTSALGNPDIIIVELGVNDAYGNYYQNPEVQLGNYDYTTPYKNLPMTTDSFRNAYIKGMKALQAKYPNATIIGLILLVKINGNPCTDFYESMINICETLQIPYVAITDYEKKDFLHPNAAGMTTLARAFSSVVEFLPPLEKTNKINHLLTDTSIASLALNHGPSLITQFLTNNADNKFESALYRQQTTINKNHISTIYHGKNDNQARWPGYIVLNTTFPDILAEEKYLGNSEYPATFTNNFLSKVAQKSNYLLQIPNNIQLFDLKNYNYYFTINFSVNEASGFGICLATYDSDNSSWTTWFVPSPNKSDETGWQKDFVYVGTRNNEVNKSNFIYTYLIDEDILIKINENKKIMICLLLWDNNSKGTDDNSYYSNIFWDITPIPKML